MSGNLEPNGWKLIRAPWVNSLRVTGAVAGSDDERLKLICRRTIALILPVLQRSRK